MNAAHVVHLVRPHLEVVRSELVHLGGDRDTAPVFCDKAIGPQDAAPVTTPAGYFNPLGFRGDLAKRDHTAPHLSDLSTWETDRLSRPSPAFAFT